MVSGLTERRGGGKEEGGGGCGCGVSAGVRDGDAGMGVGGVDHVGGGASVPLGSQKLRVGLLRTCAYLLHHYRDLESLSYR